MPLPTYLMSNFPSVRPSLNLQFDSQPTPEDMTSHLASVGATFSRASIGTYTDANGLIQEASAGQARPNYSTAGVHEGLLIEESRTNLLKSSEDFSTTDWTEVAISTTINQGIAPDGLAGADLISGNGASGSHRVFHTFTPSAGADYTASIYAKAGTNNFIQIAISGGSSFGVTNYTNFDLANGTVEDESNQSGSIEDVGNGWYRCIVTLNNSGTASASQIDFIIIQSGTSTRLQSWTTSNNVYVWGAQLEAGSFPTSYIPTIPTFSSRASTATYFDSSGVLQTASIDEARTDHKYIDGQWVEAGLLLEGASTNLILNSNTSDWSVVRGTRGSATTFATNIDGFLYSATSTSPNINESFGTASTGDYVFSMYVDATNSDEFDMRFAVDGNASNGVRAVFTPSTESFGSITQNTSYVTSGSGKVGFEKIDTNIYRIYISANFTAGSVWFPVLYYEDNATNVAMGGFQIEAGTQPSSLIQTSGSTVTRSADVYTTATKTRSADVCYIDGTAFTDFYNQEQGTLFAHALADHDLIGANKIVATIYDNSGAANNRLSIRFTASDNNRARFILYNGGAVSADFSPLDGTNDRKLAFAFAENDFEGLVNGTSGNYTSGSMPIGVDKLQIGDTPVFAGDYNGTIKKLIYFPRRLSNAELTKLTQ